MSPFEEDLYLTFSVPALSQWSHADADSGEAAGFAKAFLDDEVAAQSGGVLATEGGVQLADLVAEPAECEIQMVKERDLAVW